MSHCDILHLSGGDTFSFLRLLRQRKLLPHIRAFAESGGVIVGTSAGAILMTPHIGINRLYGTETPAGLSNLSALGLVEFEFFPHLTEKNLFSLREYSRGHPSSIIYGCADGDGIIVTGGKLEFIGNVSEVVNGTVLKTANLRISEATEADYQSISHILDEACRWLAEKGIRQWTAPFSEEYIDQKIAAREFHIIHLDEQPVGVFRLLWLDPVFWGDVPDDAAYIHTLALQRRHAGQGLTKHAIAWALGQAKQHGKKYLRLDCMAGNERLMNYYKALGFVPVGTRNVRDFQVTLMQRSIVDQEPADKDE